MRFRRRILGLLVSLFCATVSGACPDWLSRAPACPKGDNTILPDNYPAFAHVIADGNSRDGKYVADYVERVFRLSGDRVPLMVLPVRKGTLDEVRARIRTMSKDVGQVERWLAALVPVEGTGHEPWQQDIYESFFEPSGKIVLRPIREIRGSEDVTPIVAALDKACPGVVKEGESLPPESEKGWAPANPHIGGNIEALPGGLCLYGKSQGWDFAKHYCGSRKNAVEVDTTFLHLEHVDEVMGLVKTRGKEPCNFAITVASPKRALEVLKGDKGPWISFFTGDRTADTREVAKSRMQFGAMQRLCRLISRLRHPDVEGDERRRESTPGTHGSWWNLLYPNAWAGLERLDEEKLDCKSATGDELRRAIENDRDLRLYNELIEKTMRENQALVARKLKERLPACTPKFIPMPALFYGGKPVSIAGALTFPVKLGRAFFPNPNNGVPVENGVITPHPQQEAFARDIERSLKEAGVENLFMDSFKRAHINGGNVHCTSHQLRYCKPRDRI